MVVFLPAAKRVTGKTDRQTCSWEINRYLFLCSHTDSIACGQTRHQRDGNFWR